jgi:PAS domain S-box-containing protein
MASTNGGRLLQQIADQSRDLIAAVDGELRITALNAACREEFHLSFGVEAEAGARVPELLAHRPEVAAPYEAHLRRALEGASFTAILELRPPWRRRDVYEFTFRPLRADDGRIIGASHIGRRITKRPAARRQLRRVERQSARRAAHATELLTHVLDSMADAVVVKDSEGRYLLANPAAVRAFGRPVEDIIGRTDVSIHGPHIGRQLAAQDRHVARTGRSILVEQELDVGGRRRTWLLAKAPLRDGGSDPRGVVVVARDVTADRRTQDGLRSSKETAERASHAKSRFMAVLSHELRTPLSAIIGYAELLAAGTSGPTTPTQRRQLERIRVTAWQLIEMMDEILGHARAEAGREELRIESVDAAAIARQSAEIIEGAAAAKGVHVDASATGQRIVVRADPGKLRQILMNLLGNAVKFTEAGSVTIVAAREGDDACVHVRDTGPGIEQEDLERIFEPFTRGADPAANNAGGTGLGLSLSRRFAEMMGGSLHVRSRPGDGSTFTLRLPLAG